MKGLAPKDNLLSRTRQKVVSPALTKKAQGRVITRGVASGRRDSRRGGYETSARSTSPSTPVSRAFNP